MESLIDYCEKSTIEVESVAPLISKSLKDKIRIEMKLEKGVGVLVIE